MSALRWIGAVLFLGASLARAAGPCEEDRGQTGLALAVGPSGGLTVAAVDEDSPASASGVAVGDAVVQVNSTLAGGCGEYARAVRDARQHKKALLVLVRRGGGEVPLALASATWDREVASVPPPVAAEPPSVRTIVAASPPAPLPPETYVTLDGVTHDLAALAGEAGPSARLDAYQRDVGRVERQVATLAVRDAAPAPVVAGLRTVLRYYRAAAVAWASAEDQRQAEGRPRHFPSVETSTAPYFGDSQVAVVIDEFPFVRDTVVRDPRPGAIAGEAAGLWRPLQARALLWERGRDELNRFTTWLAAGSRQE
jgi:hypothetical protein